MNTEILITFFIGAIISAVLAVRLRKVRHEFIVLEGFAGLLYHKGKFAERLDAGRHLRWGRHFTITMVDLRKSLLNVPGRRSRRLHGRRRPLRRVPRAPPRDP